ncbi:MAG TPA: hypothetical protein PLQ44_03710 [Candidatus Paceibacterota bacterium]|nr:hypothetical protein [Candidatus Paceibacterota bacterium]HPT40675.1 hypothetical protein [Candidatus Paceibacterota bacterium]
MDNEIKKEVVRRRTTKKPVKKSNHLVLWIVLGILIVASGVVLFLNLKTSGYLDKFLSKDEGLYLVSLNSGSNNVFYYGQIIKDNKEIIVLKNPGYLDVQAGKEKDDQPTITFRQTKDDSLKPLPIMTIYKNNVVFVQELASDSPIVEAYENIK